MTTGPRPPIPRILASACLCGAACRYDGRSSPHPALTTALDQGLVVPVCPEILGGLPVPRPPCELRDGRVVDRLGTDRTAAFLRGAQKTLAIARQRKLTVAVLKDNSPSCGATHVYDGTFCGRLVPGRGLAAALLAENGVRVLPDHEVRTVDGLIRVLEG